MVLGLVPLVALAVRVALVHHGWPAGFRYTLDFDAANAARTIYLTLTAGNAGGWQHAWLAAGIGRFIEPPILQTLTALTYLPGGVERPWTSMVFTTVFWFGGSALLFLALRRLTGWWGATLGATYLLLAPFAVAVSLSFQVESLVVFGLAAVLWCASLGDVTRGRLFLLAAVVGAGAGLIKPGVVLPLIWAMYGWAALRGQSFRDRERLVRLGALLALTALPAVVYALVLLPAQLGDKILPQLLVSGEFYRGWAANVIRVVGVVPLVGGLVGFAVASRLRLLGLLLGAGYLVISAVLTWHTMTHDYYQVPLLVIVAVGLGGLAEEVVTRLGSMQRHATAATWAVAAVLVLAASATLALAPKHLLGLTPGRYPAAAEDEAIGRVVGPGQSVIAYSPNYGKPLSYYGRLIVTDWPQADTLTYQATLGWPSLDDAARLADMMQTNHAHYFVVTNPPAPDPSLLAFLDARFPLVHADAKVRIYDLRRPLTASAPGAP
jgi:hypothetical protein